MAKDIFDRLSAGRPPATEGVIKQPPRRREDPKIFLKDILANGPAPATLVIERGTERGFTKRQITYAREQMKLIALKGPGMDGCWFWMLPHDNRGIPAQQATPKPRHRPPQENKGHTKRQSDSLIHRTTAEWHRQGGPGPAYGTRPPHHSIMQQAHPARSETCASRSARSAATWCPNETG